MSHQGPEGERHYYENRISGDSSFWACEVAVAIFHVKPTIKSLNYRIENNQARNSRGWKLTKYFQ
jgi:hypothetical protein